MSTARPAASRRAASRPAAEAAGASPVTKWVERLEARGAIRREVDPADKRARRLYPTEEGLVLLEAVAEGVRRTQARLLAPLGKGRARQFVAMLQEVAAAHNAASRVALREP
jgi:DNA-binding MarR family transcriptional regulator